MGFLFEDLPEVKPTKTKAVAEKHRGARGCDECPLKSTWPTLRSPRMGGPKQPVDILVVGESPSVDADRLGTHFTEDEMRLVRSVIAREDFGVTSMVRCATPNGRTPTELEVHCCSIHFEEEIARLRPKVVVGMGSLPLQKVDPPFEVSQQVTRIHGSRMAARCGKREFWFIPALHPEQIMRKGGARSNMMGLFRADLKQAGKSPKWGSPSFVDYKKVPIEYLTSVDEVVAGLESMGSHFAVDIETNDLRPWAQGAKWLTVAMSNDTKTIAFSIDHRDLQLPVKHLVLDKLKKSRWIAHNAIFEYSWFRHHGKGEWFPGEFDDTMLLAHLFHHRNTLLGLGALTRVHLGTDIKTLPSPPVKELGNYPIEDVLEYNALDAASTWMLYQKIKIAGRHPTYAMLINQVRSTCEMILRGLPVDMNRANELLAQATALMNRYAAEASNLYECREYERLTGKSFSISSNDTIATVLKEIVRVDMVLKESGKAATDETVLSKIPESVTPLPAIVLNWREHAKLQSTYLEPVASGKLIAPDGLLHPQYSVGRTHTFRLSSEEPNIQNFPKRQHREIRGVVRAPPGHLVVSADSGQIEARIVAMISKDRRLCDEFIGHIDVHSSWTKRAMEIDPTITGRVGATPKDDEKKLFKLVRNNRIKGGLVFAALYGAHDKTIAAQVGWGERENTMMLREFWAAYPSVKRWQNTSRSEYAEYGYVTNMFGNRRYGIMPGNEPINTPVQGTMAFMMLEVQNAMWALAEELKDPYLYPRINIHDDLTFILPDSNDTAAYIEVIADEMVKARWSWVSVPLTVEIAVGERWDYMEEIYTKEGAFFK